MIEPLVELFLDIETTSTGLLDIQLEVEQSVKPPSNYTREETITNWVKTKRPKAIKEALAKTALDPTFGEIVAIGWAIGWDKIRCEVRSPLGGGQEEAEVLRKFFNQDAQTDALPVIVGHNIAKFDIPFLWARAAVNSVPVPAWFPPIDVKPWSPQVFDTEQKWPGMRSQKDLYRALGFGELRGPDDIDGSQVPGLWQDGEVGTIRKHCMDDVDKVRRIWQRLKAVGF